MRAALTFLRMVGTGAAIPGLNSTAFKSVPVALPPPHLCQTLFSQLDALVSAALGAAMEAAELRTSRDELLPLLLAGAVSPGEVAVLPRAG